MPKVGNPYKMEDVEKNGWVVINGQVCDLKEFKNIHPGGVQVINDYSGKDASDQWNMIHAPTTIQNVAPETIIGYIEE